jgi:hypothetical protein
LFVKFAGLVSMRSGQEDPGAGGHAMIAATIVAALLAGSEPSAAAATTTPPPPTADAARKDPNKVVCRFEETYGSRMKTRVCKTRGEWEAQEANAQKFLRDAGSHAAQQVAPSTAPAL